MKKVANVTARDIKYGKGSDPCECPIARAVKRLYPKMRVDVGKCCASVRAKDLAQGDNYLIYVFEHNGQAFIEEFDNGREVLPCQIELNLVSTAEGVVL